MVLASRFISCTRKSIFRPTGPSESTSFCSCWKWEAQAHGLLVHGHLVGEDGHLGENPLLVKAVVLEQFLDLGPQALPVGLHRLGGDLLYLVHQGDDLPRLLQNVRLKPGALGLPHFQEGSNGHVASHTASSSSGALWTEKMSEYLESSARLGPSGSW